MKITYEKIYRSYPVFKHLLEQSLPINTTIRIKKFIEQLNPHLLQIENIQNELLENYSSKTEDGVFEMDNEEKKHFIEMLQTALTPEITVSFEKLKISDLGTKCSISAKDLEEISYLLDDYDEVLAYH
jgi:hypothetical protein